MVVLNDVFKRSFKFNINIWKVLLICLSTLFSLQLFSQVTEKPLVYDDEAIRHESARDLIPLFGGYIPSSFFICKNYISTKERQVE